MSLLVAIIALVALQRFAELLYAERNTRALKRRGGVEHGHGHYALIVAVHAAWLIAILMLVPHATPPSWPLLALFAALQLLRLWIIATLGPYWTTRVISVPDAPLVRHGPYRFVRHPNYLVVIGEIALLPLTFGAWGIALFFSVLNLAVLWWRVRIEEAALAPRRSLG